MGASYGGADTVGEKFTYMFDAMGRPSGMTSNNNATNWIAGVTYNELGLPTASRCNSSGGEGRGVGIRVDNA